MFVVTDGLAIGGYGVVVKVHHASNLHETFAMKVLSKVRNHQTHHHHHHHHRSSNNRSGAGAKAEEEEDHQEHPAGGNGDYDNVDRKSNADVAIKDATNVISMSQDASTSFRKDKEYQIKLKIELKILSELPFHPFLQQCHYAFESRLCLFYVIDYNSGADLLYQFNKRKMNNSKFH